MPKSSKKRKEKAADFSKAKLKLGKGKKLPSNAVDTSFKARSIVLPTQSLPSTSGGNEVTKRGLSFDDLMSQLRHYNPSTRRDALLGLKDLFTSHPPLLLPSLPNLFPPLFRVTNDSDPTVRKTLLSLLNFILPQIPTDTLIPHVKGLLMHVSAAQTHIFPEIRVDGVRFVECLLEVVPTEVVSGWEEEGRCRVLEGFLSMLCAGTRTKAVESKNGSVEPTSAASVVLSPTSKLTIYQSLSLFLNKALLPASHGHHLNVDIWFLRPLFATPQAYQSFNKLLRPESANCAEFAECNGQIDRTFSWHLNGEQQGVWDVSRIVESVDECYFPTSTQREGDPYVCAAQSIARSLNPTILSAILDNAPTLSTEIEIKTLAAILNIARVLYSVALKNSDPMTSKELVIIIKRVTPYFPFEPAFGMEKHEPLYTTLNISFCALSSLVPPSNTDHEHVRKYILKLLAPCSGLGGNLSPDVYLGLIPAIWGIVMNECENGVEVEGEGMLERVIQHSIRLGSKAYLKGATIEFVGTLILLDTENTTLLDEYLPKKATREWIEHLPKVLWEIGTGNLELTELILRFLLRLIQRNASYSLPTLASLLSPFFSTAHPTRGVIYGPFSKLDVKGRTNRLALDLVRVVLDGDVGPAGWTFREGVARCTQFLSSP